MKKNVMIAIAISLVFLASIPAAIGAQPPKYRIGIVFDIAGRGDKSYNDGAYNGLKLVAQAYKGYIKGDPDKVNSGTEIELKYLEPKQGGQDREQLLRVLAEDGYNLVFGIGFAFTGSIEKVAKDFPKTNFALIDGTVAGLNEDSNLTCISFAEHEGSFLIGALCGLMISDKPAAKLGFLGGMDNPLVHKFQSGFIAGATYVNSRLRKPGMIIPQYVGKDTTAFRDPKTASAIASAQYNSGAEIVFHASGGSGAGLFEAAKYYGKEAIGVDTDQGYSYMTNDKDTTAKEVGKYILTSMLKRVDQSIFVLSRNLIEQGRVKGGYKVFGLSDNGVGLAVNEFNQAKLSPYAAKIEALKSKIVAGQIVVPSNDADTAAFVNALK